MIIKRQLQSLKIQLSSDSIIDVLEDLHKVHEVPFEVCISSQMLRVIKTSLGLQKTFPNETPESLQPKITIYKLKEKMVQKAHSKCIERLRVFYNKKGTLILEAGMMSHIHAVPVYLVYPLISPEPTLLSIYTRLCTVDGLSKLVTQTIIYLQQFKIGVGGATTNGGSSFTSALSPFSKQNYSIFLPQRLSKLIQNRCANHFLDRDLKNAIDMHYDIYAIVIIMEEDISSLHSQSNSNELSIYLKSYGKTRWIGMFLVAEQVMDHSEEIIQLKSSRKYNSVKFTTHIYYLTKPLFETTSVLESNTSQVSNVFPLAVFLLIHYYHLLVTIFSYEPWLSFIKTLCKKIFFYIFGDDYIDLFACDLAFCYSGKKLMQQRNLAMISSTTQSLKLTFVSKYYVSEIIPSIPFFDIKSIQIPQKPDKYPEHRILKLKIENAYQLAISQIQITDPTAPCFILVQKINWNSSVLAIPSSEAGIEKKFSQAKRFMGISGQRMSLLTLFCKLKAPSFPCRHTILSGFCDVQSSLIGHDCQSAPHR
ncbi:MAG: hypothetical protein EZS28_004030 [Streblomastix strix]|uniref:Uncharacterized protein n=1 Tax=Streblomastix strix TaxID=222440 RepID=A0A5J4X059_9EUKA|nr:MAG: hypothetical protein EZS28_004030 [Streblomastix strix]